ncbi:hypothetical protein M0R45_026982 [Rubus argutus]|uniref:Pentatricopeptide repeat-containing protein n=1 Tax=Rubus argutus TaxID=59490 RepID=A0AAW1X0S8_RUBAR
MNEKRFNPPVRGRDLLVEGLLNAGYIEPAKDMVRKMVKQSCAPDVSTFNALIEAIWKYGEVDFCIDLYCEMKVVGHPPNRPVYTMLITMSGRGGRFVEAANYLMEMTEFGLMPLSRWFDLVTDGLKNNGKHDLARRIEQLEVSLRDT